MGASPTTGGGVWSTGGAAVDGSGNIYRGDGQPAATRGEPITGTNYDYSDSVVKLSLGNFVELPRKNP